MRIFNDFTALLRGLIAMLFTLLLFSLFLWAILYVFPVGLTVLRVFSDITFFTAFFIGSYYMTKHRRKGFYLTSFLLTAIFIVIAISFTSYWGSISFIILLKKSLLVLVGSLIGGFVALKKYCL